MKRIMTCLLLALAPPLGLAANAACGLNYCSGLIQALYIASTGDVYVAMVGGLTGVNCTPLAGGYATLQASAANFKPGYAALLAAQMIGRPVTVRMVDGSAGCTIQYITVP